MKQRDTDLARCWREKQAGFAAAADMIGRLLDEWEAGRAEIDALRAVLIEAQECIDYGTRAGGAAEVLAHIATVLKGDGHATVMKGSATTGREMAVVAAAKAWRDKLVGQCLAAGVTFSMTPEVANLLAAVNHLLEAEVTGDESWQARRAELLAGLFSDDEDIPAALDRAFEFGRGMR